MKLILTLLSLLAISSSAISATLWQKMPGKDYTYRDRLIQRQLIQDLRNKNKPAPLEGNGMEFQGNVEITENKETKEKEYLVYIRNCGKVKLNKKSEEEMKALKSGSKVQLIFGESCSVQDWKKLY